MYGEMYVKRVLITKQNISKINVVYIYDCSNQCDIATYEIIQDRFYLGKLVGTLRKVKCSSSKSVIRLVSF